MCTCPFSGTQRSFSVPSSLFSKDILKNSRVIRKYDGFAGASSCAVTYARSAVQNTGAVPSPRTVRRFTPFRSRPTGTFMDCGAWNQSPAENFAAATRLPFTSTTALQAAGWMRSRCSTNAITVSALSRVHLQ